MGINKFKNPILKLVFERDIIHPYKVLLAR